MKKETITFSMNHTQEQVTCAAGGEQRISSLDIAVATGKEHKNVLRAIREMEPAWEKECGLKFELTWLQVFLGVHKMKSEKICIFAHLFVTLHH